MTKRAIFSATLAVTAAFFTVPSMTVSAQSEPMRVNQQAASNVAKPKHGQTMDQVEAAFGLPVERLGTVGEPPITRWRYDNFTVYFEHDKVIHSVAHPA